MNLKEKSKSLKKNKITMKKVKRQAKGITLIALVVTIIVLLILAGIALNLTIGENGIFSRAEKAANTWRNAETNEQLALGELGNWIGNYLGENGNGEDTGDDTGSGITWHEDVPIPEGFYYVGGEKDTGLIISDSADDIDNDENSQASSFEGNQFVWVPVANPENYFQDVQSGQKLNGVETTTNVYSKLKIRSGDSYTAGTPNETSKVREPDVLSSYDTSSTYLSILNFADTTAMAENFVAEYKAMSDSIKKYNGFYIGRYELTGTVETPTEKAGASLTNQDWYNLYKACQNVVTGKENVKSTMIYGVQWDAVCDWLKQRGFDTDSNSSSWGNYSSGSKISTGSNPTYGANGIFDLAGNCWERTQEAASADYRIIRGGDYYNSGSGIPASARSSYDSSGANSNVSSRATLYIK